MPRELENLRTVNLNATTSVVGLRPPLIPRAAAHGLLDRLFDLAEGVGSVAVAATVPLYSQADGQRFPGAGRTKHLRVWQEAFKAGDPGATKQGRARLLTKEAWLRYCELPSRKTPPAPISAVAPNLDDEILERLGGKRRAS